MVKSTSSNSSTSNNNASATKKVHSKSDKRSKTKQGFMDFVREQGIVGLAVGLAIGTQASATVKAITDGFINPIVGFLVGSQDGLALASWNVIGPDTPDTDYWITLGNRILIFRWGMVLASVITLLTVLAVIYYLVKVFKLDKLDKKKPESKK